MKREIHRPVLITGRLAPPIWLSALLYSHFPLFSFPSKHNRLGLPPLPPLPLNPKLYCRATASKVGLRPRTTFWMASAESKTWSVCHGTRRTRGRGVGGMAMKSKKSACAPGDLFRRFFRIHLCRLRSCLAFLACSTSASCSRRFFSCR
jgi:hypothetical protein